MTGSFALTAALGAVYKVIGKESILNILLIRNAMTFAATIFFICIASILLVNARKFDMISAVSMEIYLLHMIVIDAGMEFGMQKYPCVLVFAVLVVVIILSNLYHKCLKYIGK